MMEEEKMLITLQTRWILRERGFFFSKRNWIIWVLSALTDFCWLISDHSIRKEHRAVRTLISVSPLLAERQCESQIHDFIDNTSKLCKSYLLLKTVGSLQLLNNSPIFWRLFEQDKLAMGKVAFCKGYFHCLMYGPDWLNSRYRAGTNCEDHFDFLYVLIPRYKLKPTESSANIILFPGTFSFSSTYTLFKMHIYLSNYDMF